MSAVNIEWFIISFGQRDCEEVCSEHIVGATLDKAFDELDRQVRLYALSLEARQHVAQIKEKLREEFVQGYHAINDDVVWIYVTRHTVDFKFVIQ